MLLLRAKLQRRKQWRLQEEEASSPRPKSGGGLVKTYFYIAISLSGGDGGTVVVAVMPGLLLLLLGRSEFECQATSTTGTALLQPNSDGALYTPYIYIVWHSHTARHSQ